MTVGSRVIATALIARIALIALIAVRQVICLVVAAVYAAVGAQYYGDEDPVCFSVGIYMRVCVCVRVSVCLCVCFSV